MLDTVDFRAHPKLPEFGGYGQVHVRWGKAKRGGGPQRRTVLTVFDWAVGGRRAVRAGDPTGVRLPGASGGCS